MSVTQEQIAKRLGISTKSIMRVMNGHKSVSESTRLKVLNAAKQMGYDEHSNLASRTLVARRYGRHIKTGIIAVAMPSGLDHLRDAPFFAPILDGIEQYADRCGLDIYIWYQRPDRPMPRLIRENSVDGVICLSASLDLMQTFLDSTLPVVSVVSSADIAHVIGVDNREGCRLAVHHLAELGHRRIAYLGLEDQNSVAKERLTGYRQGLMEAKLPECPEIVDATLLQFRTLSNDVQPLMARHKEFSAVVCYNDTIAMAAVSTLKECGVRVPQDVSVVGFDDISVASAFEPALTSIGYDRMAMGARASEMVNEISNRLVSQNNAGKAEPFLRETFSVQLIVRNSTCAYHDTEQ